VKFIEKIIYIAINLLLTACLFLNKKIFLDLLISKLNKANVATEMRSSLFLSVCELISGDFIDSKCIEKFCDITGASLHYSQEGEDIVLARLLGERSRGFYVDVGAHHATRFSNTYALYRKGWRGLNIDATPGSMESFCKMRPGDINLEVSISDQKDPLVFHMFREGALNTFDSALARSYIDGGWEQKGSVEMVPKTLAQVLDEHLEAGQKIDLMNIDVEGEDLGVLKSNDWNKYCPEIVIVEALDTPLTCLNENPLVAFLKIKGYVPTSRLFNSIIFRRVAGLCAAS